MTTFSFATAGRIQFGPGVANQAAEQAGALGRKALLVTGSHPERAARLTHDLRSAGLEVVGFQIPHEPDTDVVAAGAALARDQACDLVIAFGGGSALDGAKAVAALAVNTGPVTDYLEVIGKALPLTKAPLPFLAIPTTAGTGAEVTANAVIRSAEHRVKVSLRSPRMLPEAVLVDPELTLSLPPVVTAATGCDALCQLLEAFVSAKANPLTDGLCREGLPRCARALETAYFHGDNLAARTDMALAALFSGMALANGGLGAVHGIAGPLGGLHAVPHGAVCARLLPFVTAANIETLENRPENRHHLERFRQAAVLLTGRMDARARDLVPWLKGLADSLEIPPLSHWGLRSDELPALAAQSLKASSMRGNPVAFSLEDLEGIIAQAME